MIHVLHNCQGLNARPLYLISADQNQWGSYEEYLTILGGSINESHFLTEYGAKARVTHVALGSEILFQPEGRKEVRSLNDIRPKSMSKSELSTVERFHSYKDCFSSVKSEKNNAEIVQEKEIVPTFKKT